MERMTDVSRVADRIWTGADLPAHLGSDAVLDEVDELTALGITHVVDCRLEWSDDAVYAGHAPDVAYLHHAQDDAGQQIPDEWWTDGTRWANQALDGNPAAQVLMHCHMGINRGPSLTYALLLSRGVGHLEGLDLIRSARPVAGCAYAEQAADWWLRHSGATFADRVAVQEDIDGWRERNPLDVVRLIRTEREAGR